MAKSEDRSSRPTIRDRILAYVANHPLKDGEEGYSPATVGRELGTSRQRVHQIMAKAGIPRRDQPSAASQARRARGQMTDAAVREVVASDPTLTLEEIGRKVAPQLGKVLSQTGVLAALQRQKGITRLTGSARTDARVMEHEGPGKTQGNVARESGLAQSTVSDSQRRRGVAPGRKGRPSRKPNQ